MTAPALERPHGHTRYQMEGCRCDVCRDGKSAYERRTAVSRLAGTWQPFVDAQPVREHLMRLGQAGIGYKRAALLAGLSWSVCQAVLYGKGGHAPSARIRPATAARLLAVPVDPALLAPSARVPIDGTARRVQALACIGWSLSAQAARLGWTVQNFAWTVNRREAVEARTAQAVAYLFEDLSMTPAPGSQSATRTRNHAFRNGWFGPLAWDDDTIDDPAAFPLVLPPIGPTVPGADELAIQHVAAGHTQPASLPYASRMEWVRRMRAAGTTARDIGRLVGMADTSVLEMAKKGDYYAANIGQVAA